MTQRYNFTYLFSSLNGIQLYIGIPQAVILITRATRPSFRLDNSSLYFKNITELRRWDHHLHIDDSLKEKGLILIYEYQ